MHVSSQPSCIYFSVSASPRQGWGPTSDYQRQDPTLSFLPPVGISRVSRHPILLPEHVARGGKEGHLQDAGFREGGSGNSQVGEAGSLFNP